MCHPSHLLHFLQKEHEAFLRPSLQVVLGLPQATWLDVIEAAPQEGVEESS